ncbi:MAG: FlgD immunoglobulin-like domain containing protein [Pseudomonadota bacterium]|nr:FlgD immunoglobulin-like domain containing protein [Pseudomonadota bacterium]
MKERRYTTLRIGAVMMLLLLSSYAVAAPVAAIEDYASESFAPVRGESFSIPVHLNDPSDVKRIKVEIRSSDGDLMRTLVVAEIAPDRDDYEVKWDGKDDAGNVVPDEAYLPVVIVTMQSNESITISEQGSSGGEELYDFEKSIRPGVIEYSLPAASRMLVRSGIKNGPMLRTLIDWQPRTSGFHAERWNGRDNDDVIAIEQNPEVGYLIVGYELPHHSIITHGNNSESYRRYRERRNWPLIQANEGERTLERNGRLLRQESYQPLLQQKSPRIDVSLLSAGSRQPLQHLKALEEMLIEVKLHPLDEVYLDQERYEISFFVDHAFIAEEEQGYVPFTWRWSPGRLGIKPGEHLLTVNVSGYNGQVGVKNIRFSVDGDEVAGVGP